MHKKRVSHKFLFYWYIVKEIFPLFIIGILIFSSILAILQLLRLSENIIAYGIGIEAIFFILLLLIPAFLVFTIPISMLMATLLAFARLSSDEEYTAINSAGVSLFDLYPVVAVFSLLCFLFTAYSSTYFEPWSRKFVYNQFYNTSKSKASMVVKEKLKEGVFVRDFFNQVLYVEKLYDQGQRMDKVYLSTQNHESSKNPFIFSQQGRIYDRLSDSQTIFELKNGYYHNTLSPNEDLIMKFEKAEVNLIDLFEAAITPKGIQWDSDYMNMYPDEMLSYIEERGRTTKDKHYFRAIFLLHQKMALPFACIVFGIFAMPLGLQNPRTGKSKGYLVGLGVILTYYLIIMATKSYAEQSLLEPVKAAWIPNIVALFVSIWYFIIKNNSSTMESPVLDKLKNVFYKLGKIVKI